MRKTTMVVGLAGICGVAWGGPTGPTGPTGPATPAKFTARAKPTVMNPMDANFSENFDGYANGSAIIGQGGWAAWDIPAGSYPVGLPPTAFADNTHSASAPNGARATLAGGSFSQTDMVHALSAGGTGKWTIKCKVYTPSTSVGEGYFIINNHYNTSTGIVNWSVQIHMNPQTLQVTSDFNNPLPPLALIMDQWVEIVCNVDLTVLPNGKCDITYGGQPLHMGRDWIGVVSTLPNALLDIQNVNLYSATSNECYFDDFSLTQVATCYPDCNGDTLLNLADFGCFQTKFALQDLYADCNGDTILNLADFGCFQTKFALGCP